MHIFFGLDQSIQSEALLREIQDTSRKANRSEQLYANLLERQERMALVCQALLELVQSQLAITDEELEAKIHEVDMRDGKKDGKFGGRVFQCPQCGRNVNSKRPVCVFCGTKSPNPDAF